MYEAAQNDGITLIIVSGFRSYEYQKNYGKINGLATLL